MTRFNSDQSALVMLCVIGAANIVLIIVRLWGHS